MNLSDAQSRTLSEIATSEDGRRYNGRAHATLDRLRAHGLITVEWVPRPHSRLLIARITEEGKRVHGQDRYGEVTA